MSGAAKISLCCITGNEEPAVLRFLESFRDAFDELCLVRAVGCTPHDRTMALAKEWCAKQGKAFCGGEYFNGPEARDWPHVDDFAAARNQSWALATCDWQMWADLDDLLEPGTPDKPAGAELIRLCAMAGTHDFFYFTYDIRTQSERNVRERLFRRGIASWEHPVHEKCRAPARADGVKWRGLIEPKVVFEHAPQVGKARDPMRNRRIMGHHTRFIDLYAFELHREWFYDWQVSKNPEHAEQATHWAELAHQTSCLPEQRYDALLNQAQIASVRDLDHAIDLCWSAIRIHPKDRTAWARLAEYELSAGRGGRAAVATGFMQSIPKAQETGYPQSNRYHGWEGAHLRARSLRAAGQHELAQKNEDSIFKANGCRISLLHATRKRPDLALLTRSTFYRAALMPLGVEHIFAIDADDTESLAALKDYRHVVVENPHGCVKAWNAAAAASSGQVLVQLSDDWNPCHDWDVLIWEALEAYAKRAPASIVSGQDGSGGSANVHPVPSVGEVPAVLAINDGHRRDQLLCMAICTRARYEQQGRELFSGEYFGVFSDNEFSLRAYLDGVVVQAQHIVMEHAHPLWQGKPEAEWHETTRRQNAPERYAEGLAIYNRRNPAHAIK